MRWNELKLNLWMKENGLDTQLARSGKMYGFRQDGEVSAFIACGNSWNDVARRMKASNPTSVPALEIVPKASMKDLPAFEECPTSEEHGIQSI